MYERFTDRARKVMLFANQEAQRFNHEYIGTEHVLLGLVKEGSGVAANVLKNLDVDLRKIRLEVEKLVESRAGMMAMGKLPQTPAIKKVVEYSMEEARNLNQNYVGTESILLGLLREQHGIAFDVLTNLGVTIEEVREETRCLLALDSQYTRFTDRSRKVMALGEAAARRLNHESVGSEHILLGLIKEGSGIAANILKNLDLSTKTIQAEVERLSPAGKSTPVTGRLSRNAHAEKVIDFAWEEARRLKHNYLGTEHLLLGTLREQDGLAARVLLNLGLKLEDVRQEVLNLLGHGS